MKNNNSKLEFGTYNPITNETKMGYKNKSGEMKFINKKKLYKNIFCAGIYAIFIYLIISCAVFRFNHPKMTETELFLNIPKAILWDYK